MLPPTLATAVAKLLPANRGAELGTMNDAEAVSGAADRAERTSRESRARTQAEAFAHVRTRRVRWTEPELQPSPKRSRERRECHV